MTLPPSWTLRILTDSSLGKNDMEGKIGYRVLMVFWSRIAKFGQNVHGFKKNRAGKSWCRYIRFCNNESNGVILNDTLSGQTVFVNFSRNWPWLAALNSSVVMHIIDRCLEKSCLTVELQSEGVTQMIARKNQTVVMVEWVREKALTGENHYLRAGRGSTTNKTTIRSFQSNGMYKDRDDEHQWWKEYHNPQARTKTERSLGEERRPPYKVNLLVAVSHALLHVRTGTPKGSVTEKLYTQSPCSIYVVVSSMLTVAAPLWNVSVVNSPVQAVGIAIQGFLPWHPKSVEMMVMLGGTECA